MTATDVKTVFVKNIPMAHGEVSVVLADNAEQLMQHSCRLAETIKQYGLGVLLINCGMSDRRFRKHALEATSCRTEQAVDLMGQYHAMDAVKPQIMLHSSVCGDLVGEADTIRGLVAQCPAQVVIVAGWEWTSSGYRRKERLLYALREMMEEKDVIVIIYSQAQTKPVLGRYDRGGIGKLAMLAISIVTITASDILEAASPKRKPLVASGSEWEEAERSAQLLANKINELPEVDPPSAHQEEKSRKRANMKDKKPLKNREAVLSRTDS